MCTFHRYPHGTPPHTALLLDAAMCRGHTLGMLLIASAAYASRR
jgi:hypothetical protein